MTTGEALRAQLMRLASGEIRSKRSIEELKQALLNYASETPDNVSCAENITVSSIRAWYTRRKARGLVTRRSKVSLVEALHTLQCQEVYTFLQKQFPNLTQDEAGAILRMATLVFNVLNFNISPPKQRTAKRN